MPALNTIFYGPPGTGKTYLTSRRAVQLIEDLSDAELQEQYPPDQRSKLKTQFNEYQQQGRIAVLTFHPSFAYEDFVEGIKPFKNEKNDLYYDVVDGIFKQMSYNAAYALHLAQQQRALDALSNQSQKSSESALPLRPFDALYFEFVDYLKRMMQEGSEDITFETRTGKSYQLININQNNTLAFQTSAGGKTYSVTKQSLSKMYRAFLDTEAIEQLSDISKVVGRGNTSVMWAAFHRLKTFEATRYRIYNSLLSNHQLSGNSVSAVQYQQMKRAVQQLDYGQLSPADYQQAGSFVIIIDEINRGNPASIFGELISLIENDKRAGQAEALQTILPYSREPFRVPPNLFLIGTMNSADQSVDTLDLAFRRRFTFQAIRPDTNLLKEAIVVSINQIENADNQNFSNAAEPKTRYASQKIHLDKLLNVINERLLWLRSEDYQIGHAYLLPVLTAEKPLNALREAVYQRIIPLLEEYFFDDWEKRIAVLGSSFVEELSGDFLYRGDSSVFNVPEKRCRWRTLNDAEFVEALQQIYQRA
ncbi:MAG: AAA family ATPase [Bacteroidota bacterium]